MKKLLAYLLFTATCFGQHEAVTGDANGTGGMTINTPGINYYYMGQQTYDFTGSTLVNATTTAVTTFSQVINQANSFVGGEAVTVNSSGVWVGAAAGSTLVAANANGVVSSTGLSSTQFTLVLAGACPVSGSPFTTGSIYYVPVAAGIVTKTAPSTAGQYVYPVGTAISTGVLYVALSTPSLVITTPGLGTNNTWTGTNQFNNQVEIGPNGTSTTSYFSVDPAITVPGGVSSNMEQLTGVGTASGNSYATTGLLIQPNFTLGAFTGGNVNFVDIEAGGSTTGTPASGYMLKVGGPLSGMTGAFDVVSGAVNLGSGTTTVGGTLSVTGTSTLTGPITINTGAVSGSSQIGRDASNGLTIAPATGSSFDFTLWDLAIANRAIAIPHGTDNVAMAGNLSVAGTSTLTGDASLTAPSITSATGTGITVNQTGDVRHVVYKTTTTYAAYSNAAKTYDLTIATLPAKSKITAIYEDVTTGFTGGGETVATLKVGISAGSAEILAVNSCFTTHTWGLADADMGTALTRAAAIQGGYIPNWTGTQIINVRLTTTTNNTSGLTAGSVTFYIVTDVFP